VTVALGSCKPAHVLLPAAALCGDTVLAPIGLAADGKMATLPCWEAAAASPDDHKYRRGLVLVIGGAMAGASALTAMAAQRAGAGYVVHAGAGAAMPHAIIQSDDAARWLADGRTGAVVIGPGWDGGDDEVQAVLAARKPMVFDAAAIGAALRLNGGMPLTMPAVMTPHAGEFAQHFPGLRGSKIDRTRAAARSSGAVVIHKGADTIIAAPDGRVAAGWGAPHTLATAGTGDVLAGAVAAHLAQGLDAFDAAVAGVGWHTAAARLRSGGMIADDLVAMT
jgi:hydroxyethylthiazole kinase-like uncharacterized protein yjeF